MIASLFLLLCTFSLTSDSTDYGDIYNHTYLVKADSLKESRQYEQALTIYHKALREFNHSEKSQNHIATLILIGSLQTNMANYDSAFFYLDLAFSEYNKKNTSNNKLLSDLYLRKGQTLDRTYQPDSALYYHMNALELRLKIYDEISDEVAEVHEAIGDVYKWVLQDYFNAESHYLKALAIREKIHEYHKYEVLANNFYNLATTYRSKGEHEKAVTYGRQALFYLIKNNPDDNKKIANCYNAIANAFFDAAQFDQAITYYYKAIKLAPKNAKNTEKYYTNLGGAYMETEQYDSARIIVRKSLSLLHSKGENDSLNLALAYQQLGTTFITSDIDSTLTYYDLSLSYAAKQEFHEMKIYIDKAKLYRNFNQINEIKKYSDLALELVYRENLPAKIKDHTDALSLKAYSYEKLYHLENDTEYLYKALNIYKEIDQLLVLNREEVDREFDKLTQAKGYRSHYERALNCIYEINKHNKHDTLSDLFFVFMERNKGQILANELDKYLHYSTSNILQADTLFTKSKKLDEELHFLKARLNNEVQKKAEEHEINLLQGKIFNAERKLNTVNELLSIKYPKLMNISSQPTLDLTEVKQYLVKNNTALVEYFYGDSAIYIYSYNPSTKKSKIRKTNELLSLNESLDILLNIVSNPIDLTNLNKEFNSFVENSVNLYNKLISEEIDFLRENNELIIIADRKLAYLPFEVLVRDKPTDNDVNYKSLAYLLNRKIISYAFSANLLANGVIEREDYLNLQPKALVFSYSSDHQQEDAKGTQIMGTFNEAEEIKNNIETEIFSGKNATKQNFIKYGADFQIIHLAVHGESDHNNPLMGRLNFNSLNNNTSPFLYYYELMTMNLNAELAVLSACETGLGKFFDGEGVYNLTRAFQYAGCRSVVASLWRIDDMQTSKIMKYFYEEITEQKDISTVLRNAKLAYLQESDELLSHPRYWAGMYLSGQKSPIDLHKNSNPYRVLIFILISTFLFSSMIFLFQKLR
ncbi:CHAT domain-containing protein/tetratricopeptide (TPR) repeat protein [Catalinimonas alkaloidigena]|uniref:CHAT domain-containing protein n=1 Tax=Catalinimonas alkaloidigena TaxID=1075417 RepID=UPI002406BDF9|nr:CHAT domain-containing protein [Catalinimonas alkaloidigena]MDF9794978.1 CHAT domain-containing protein/tetratricopeptide (TPR) repeat protein [Catalinimonas alkaloidigena]